MTTAQRAELAGFLRAKRAQVPHAPGRLRALGRRREPGLRREEVARLAGVSVTWYSWLEDGRDVTPSRQVLDALARALRLSEPERGELFTLAAGSPTPPRQTVAVGEDMGDVGAVVAALAPTPALVLDRHWRIAAANASAGRLIAEVDGRDPADRNLLWLTFTDPGLRARMVNWAPRAQALLSRFRERAGRYPDDERFALLADRLCRESTEFRGWWSRPAEAAPDAEEDQQYRLAEYGLLTVRPVVLRPLDQADTHLVVHLPADSGTAEAVRRMSGPGR